jgi:hypothetical protein
LILEISNELSKIEDDSLSIRDFGEENHHQEKVAPEEYKESKFTCGTLKLFVEQARIFINTEMFGKMDPYIVVEVSGSSQNKKK